MTATECSFGSSRKMRMLIFINFLPFMNRVTAIPKPAVPGYSLSQREKVSASTLLHLGANTVQKPGPVLYELNDPSSQVTRRTQFRQGIRSEAQELKGLNINYCDFSQIEVTQDSSSHLPNGMPIFHVTIINNCVTCSMEGIHIACGDWSSGSLVDPAIFRKLGYNDCIVNDGNPLAPLNLLFFEYSSTFSYPMRVSTGRSCCC